MLDAGLRRLPLRPVGPWLALGVQFHNYYFILDNYYTSGQSSHSALYLYIFMLYVPNLCTVVGNLYKVVWYSFCTPSGTQLQRPWLRVSPR